MEWKWIEKNNLKFLTLPEWDKLGVQVAFSARLGGRSQTPYTSLNLAFHVNDQIEDVLANRKMFLDALDCSIDECVAGEQVHGKKVMQVTAKDKGRGMKDMLTAFPACDALITREDMGLMGFYADCVPLYFFNPVIGVVGIAHAGWKGTVQNITREVLSEIKTLGGDPRDCLAAIGPCIGSCCYEVGENVAAVFRENFNDPSILQENTNGKYKLDLVRANEVLFFSEGILAENIAIAHTCTSCNPNVFYSYRREGLTGRMAAFIRKVKGV